MRAAIFQGIGNPLVVETIADPVPERGQVVIRVGRCGICGSDLHMAQGHTYSFELGAVPGHEIAGEVVAIGRGVERVKVGDRVAVLPFLTCGTCVACQAGDPMGCPRTMMMGALGVKGGYAEYVLANEIWCLKLPQALSMADGALVEPLAVSLRANRRSGLATGDRVLVIGAGAIGIAALYWAKRAGAGRIACSATSIRRETMARAAGAQSFLTPEDGITLAEQVHAALGCAPDIVFECAGMPGTLDLAVSAVKRGGTIMAPGFCWTPDPFMAMAAMIKEVTIRYTNVYDVREYEIAIGALDAGHVEPRAMLTQTVSLAETPQAFEGLMRHNPHCKVQIAP